MSRSLPNAPFSISIYKEADDNFECICDTNERGMASSEEEAGFREVDIETGGLGHGIQGEGYEAQEYALP